MVASNQKRQTMLLIRVGMDQYRNVAVLKKKPETTGNQDMADLALIK
jgi:hypothetical protein